MPRCYSAIRSRRERARQRPQAHATGIGAEAGAATASASLLRLRLPPRRPPVVAGPATPPAARPRRSGHPGGPTARGHPAQHASHPPGRPALLRFGARLPAGGASSAAMTCSNGSKPPSAPCCPASPSSPTASRSKIPLRRRTPGSTAPTGPTWPVSQLSGPLRDPRRDRDRACEPRLSRFSVEASLGQWGPPLEGCFPTEPLPDVDSLASCKSSSNFPPETSTGRSATVTGAGGAFDLERADPPAPDGAPP